MPPLTPGEEAEGGDAAQVAFGGPKKCNCKKSKCLKLYCDCFANGGFCGPACSCASCANKPENRDLVHAQRELIKQRNPNAFVQKIEADAALGGQHRRGCNCKKSHCMKKYCECFQAGVPCGEHCKCEACHNTVAGAGRRPPGGGAAKRARAAAPAPLPQRPPSARAAARGLSSTGAAGGGMPLQEQLKAAHAAAFHAALASAASTASATGGQDGVQQLPPPPGLLRLLQPGVLKLGEGGAPPMLIPVNLQQPGASGSGQLAEAGSNPALAAFHGVPVHPTPVAALVGPAAPPGGGGAAAADGTQAPAGQSFSFQPALAERSSGSSGHSTPRAAAAAAAAAAADVAFSLDTPAALATVPGAAAAAGMAFHPASALERLLPAADAGGAAAAAAAAGKPASRPGSARTTPTKRKPARTMTAALM